MKRAERRLFLQNLENILSTSNESLSKIAFEVTGGYNKKNVKQIKQLFRMIHPFDYKNAYPLAVNLLVRICYPKYRDTWGVKASRNELTITEISTRKSEFIRRFGSLVKKTGQDEKGTLELIDVLFSANLSPEEKEILRKKLKKEHTLYYDSLILVLSL